MWCHRQASHSRMCICSNKYLPWGASNLNWADTIEELWRCVQTIVDYMQQKALKNRDKSWKIKIHYFTEVTTLTYILVLFSACSGMILQQAVTGKRLENKSHTLRTGFHTVKCQEFSTGPRHFSVVEHSQTE